MKPATPLPWTERAVASFWSKVDRSAGEDGCWPWLYSTTGSGYGQVNMGRNQGPSLRAHRVAYTLHYGSIPDLPNGKKHGSCILHTCDNRLCCNPKHLVAGTQADNIADMKRKGRLVVTPRLSAENARKLAAYPKLVEALYDAERTLRIEHWLRPEYGWGEYADGLKKLLRELGEL